MISRVFYILSALAAVAMQLSYQPWCWDANLLPKWYAGGTVLLLMVMTWAIGNLVGNKIRMDWSKCFQTAATAGLVMECLFVFHELLQHRFSIPASGCRGTYDNACGLALSACIFASAYLPGKDKGISWNGIAVMFCLVLIVLSCSRTGILAFATLLAWLFWKQISLSAVMKGILSGMLALLLSVIIFTQKHDSTHGRRFVLERTCELVARRPIGGWGAEGFQRMYMAEQGAYFAGHPDSSEARLADEVHHPMNEFLLVWLDYGLAGLACLVAFFVVCLSFSRRSLRLLGLTSVLFVFSCFSYPFHYPVAWAAAFTVLCHSLYNIPSCRQLFQSSRFPSVVLCGCFLTILCAVPVVRFDATFSSALFYARIHKHNHALSKFRELLILSDRIPYNLLCRQRQGYLLYDAAHELFTTGQLSEAAVVASQCREHVSGYDLELLSGDIDLHSGQYLTAEQHYQRALHMCPSRFAPLEGMLRCAVLEGNDGVASNIASEIVEKPAKIPSAMTYRIKHEAKIVLDSLNQRHK